MADNILGPDQARKLNELNKGTVEDVDDVATIVVEVRDTASGSDPTIVEEMLRKRLRKASVSLSDDEVSELVKQITEGD